MLDFSQALFFPRCGQKQKTFLQFHAGVHGSRRTIKSGDLSYQSIIRNV